MTASMSRMEKRRKVHNVDKFEELYAQSGYGRSSD